MVFPDSNNRSLEAFKAKMQAALEANKNKNKAAKAKKHQQALVTRQGMVKEILRTQRYLGLLPKKQDDSALPDIGNLAVEPIDVRAPSPHIFDSEPIFIAIDCEAWEKPPRPVTEVGVATLDTRDLEGWPPGPNGENWHQHIRGRHFRIIEWRDCINSEYVQGCPNTFEFGHSELVGQDSIGSMLASCFREPFSKKLSDGTTAGQAQSEEKRNIIVVGHDLSQDINYCHAIGFSILNRGNILDTLDTVNMHRAYSKTPTRAHLARSSRSSTSQAGTCTTRAMMPSTPCKPCSPSRSKLLRSVAAKKRRQSVRRRLRRERKRRWKLPKCGLRRIQRDGSLHLETMAVFRCPRRRRTTRQSPKVAGTMGCRAIRCRALIPLASTRLAAHHWMCEGAKRTLYQ